MNNFSFTAVYNSRCLYFITSIPTNFDHDGRAYKVRSYIFCGNSQE
jgi:hypothetical protein